MQYKTLFNLTEKKKLIPQWVIYTIEITFVGFIYFRHSASGVVLLFKSSAHLKVKPAGTASGL